MNRFRFDLSSIPFGLDPHFCWFPCVAVLSLNFLCSPPTCLKFRVLHLHHPWPETFRPPISPNIRSHTPNSPPHPTSTPAPIGSNQIETNRIEANRIELDRITSRGFQGVCRHPPLSGFTGARVGFQGPETHDPLFRGSPEPEAIDVPLFSG